MSKLTNIPGIGKNMVQHLTDLGYPNVEALKGQDAEDIFREHCLHFGAGNRSCKCVLYCCRLAVHYVGHDGELPPDKQNWNDWKNWRIQQRGECGMDAMFTIVPVVIGIAFAYIIGTLIVRGVKSGREWSSNNHAPIRTVNAKITAKRMAVSTHHHHHGEMSVHHHSSSTTYYATFETDNGDRMELRVPDKEFGLLCEGDLGLLTHQGTRYKGFERSRGAV